MRVDPNYVANLVGSLDQTQATEQQLTAELSSGARVSSLGQDPLAAGENVLLLSQIQQDDSFTQSSNLVTGQLQVADSALGSVVSQLTQAISLATSANNGTMNASNVKAIASQLPGPVHLRGRPDLGRALHHFNRHFAGGHLLQRRQQHQLS
jgi:flagellar hook-associated protein 3 FlgL